MNEELFGVCELFEEKMITELVEDMFANIIIDIKAKRELVLA